MASSAKEDDLQLSDLVVKQLIGKGKYGEVFLCCTTDVKRRPTRVLWVQIANTMP